MGRLRLIATVCLAIGIGLGVTDRVFAQAQNGKSDSSAALEKQCKYVGNNFSLKFHLTSCPFAMQMWKQRRHPFRFKKEAVNQGYRPCRYCLPPYWTEVHAVLRLPSDYANHYDAITNQRQQDEVCNQSKSSSPVKVEVTSPGSNVLPATLETRSMRRGQTRHHRSDLKDT